ncbi:hypothetical protein Trichorick_00333 [Candidatus Trichorickettsia mobilis]|uniref:Uncharacterized protein n=1 Tax=Candidatus Trichorickettsia mobilis TaxID=1346319 RepID=A0ABZ0URL4_9RICK|nr:hypothetical protein Trichorick_00333 [Candidatus Trichorickettsia mobilis]
MVDIICFEHVNNVKIYIILFLRYLIASYDNQITFDFGYGNLYTAKRNFNLYKDEKDT